MTNLEKCKTVITEYLINNKGRLSFYIPKEADDKDLISRINSGNISLKACGYASCNSCKFHSEYTPCTDKIINWLEEDDEESAGRKINFQFYLPEIKHAFHQNSNRFPLARVYGEFRPCSSTNCIYCKFKPRKLLMPTYIDPLETCICSFMDYLVEEANKLSENKSDETLKKDTDKSPKSEKEKYSYYGGKDNPYEAIKIIKAWDLDFCLGNVIKYTLRAGKKNKDTVAEDLTKAISYLNYELEKVLGKSVTRNVVTNFDVYRDDILDKTRNRVRFAFNKNTKKVEYCNSVNCANCAFKDSDCYVGTLEWLLEECDVEEQGKEEDEV